MILDVNPFLVEMLGTRTNSSGQEIWDRIFRMSPPGQLRTLQQQEYIR